MGNVQNAGVMEGELRIRPVMDVGDIKANVNALQSSFNKLKLPSGITDKFNQEISKFSATYEKYQQRMSQGIKTKGDASQASKYLNEIAREYDNIVKTYSKASGLDLKSMFKIDSGPLKEAAREVENFTKQLENVDINKTGFKNLGQQLSGILKNSKLSGEHGLINQMLGDFDKGKVNEAKQALQEIQKEIEKRQYATTTDKNGNVIQKPGTYSEANTTAALSLLNQMISMADQAGIKIQDIQGPLSKATQHFDDLLNKGVTSFKSIGAAADKERVAVRGVTEEQKNLVNSMASAQQQSQMLTNRIAMYFSLYQIIRKIGDVARSAFATVKELDKSMTQTAVVTNFSVADMWEQLPQYTAAANQLGSTIKDVYDATTLYYQQGLNTNQAMGVATETLKMARIGGLQAAEATDMMTAALRGFNMQINELSAQRINDVYSKLAAITASNTKELGEAMTRTASIANSAGMEFETTSAFLAQMIETTREAPENLGTAMKTIVARFQEMKKAPEDLVDSEGELLDVNRVDKALKSVGIALTNTKGEFRDLDDVFLEIASKWDTLSMGQQRYIATMAAGSRQQSRFIAMMSNYERTMELVDAANNSAGASNEQFGKTLESMDAKLNKLKNAWDQFAMGLTNNSILKGGIDALTGIMTIVNKFVDVIGKISPKPFENINKSLVTLVGTLGVLRMGGAAFFKHQGLFGGMLTGAAGFFQGESFSKISVDMGLNRFKGLENQAATSGINSANAWNKNFNATLNNQAFAKDIFSVPQKQMEASIGQLLQNKINIAPYSNQLIDDFSGQLQKAIADADLNEVDSAVVQGIAGKLNTDLRAGNIDLFKQDAQQLKDFQINLDNIDDSKVQLLVEDFKKLHPQVNTAGSSMYAFGAALQGTPLQPFGQALMKVGQITNLAANQLTNYIGRVKELGGGLSGVWGALGSWGQLAVIILAVVAAYKALDYILNETSRTLKKQADAAADSLSSLKQETSELTDKLDQLSQLDTSFDGLVVGTAAFNEKLLESNELIDELIKKYPMLDSEKYLSVDENGRKIINQAGIEAVKNEVNARRATAETLKTLTANAVKQNELQSNEAAQMYERRMAQKSTYKYNAETKTASRRGANAEELAEFDTAIENYRKQQEVENQKTYESVASSLATVNPDVIDRELVTGLVANQYENIINSIANGTQKEMGEAYAKLHNYEFDAANKTFKDLETGEDVTEKAKEGGWDDQQVYKYIKAAEKANELMPQMETAANQLDQTFTHTWENASDGASTFVSDLLRGNLEIDEDLFDDFIAEGSDMAEKIAEKATDEQLKALGQDSRESFKTYLEELGDQLQKSRKNQFEKLGTMMLRAGGTAKVDEEGNLQASSQEIADVANQVAALKASQRNLLTTAGEQLQTYGVDTMSSFMNNMVSIYETANNAVSDKARERANEVVTAAEDIFKGVDLSKPTNALIAFTKASKSSLQPLRQMGREALQTTGATNLLRDSLLDITSSTQWTDAMKNAKNYQDTLGNFTAEGVLELSDSVGDLNSLLEEGIISAGGLALALNFDDGNADLSNLNSTTLAFLDSLGKVDSLLAKVHRDISNFNAGIDTGEGEDWVNENIKRIKELKENGEWGNNELHTRVKALVGEETWNRVVQKHGNNYQKAIQELNGTLQYFTDGYFSAWDRLATNSKVQEKLQKYNEENGTNIGVQWATNEETGKREIQISGEATQQQVLDMLQKVVGNGMSPENAERMLADFINYSPNAAAEFRSNEFQAQLNNKDWYKEQAQQGNLTLTESDIKNIAAASQNTNNPITEDELRDTFNNTVDYLKQERGTNGELVNPNIVGTIIDNLNSKGELSTNWKDLSTKVDQALGYNTKYGHGWVEKEEKSGKTTIDLSGSEANLQRSGLPTEQISGILFDTFQRYKEQGLKEFEYEDTKLKDIDKINTPEQFAEALQKAQSNEQWVTAGETMGGLIAEAIKSVLEPDDVPNQNNTEESESETESNGSVWENKFSKPEEKPKNALEIYNDFIKSIEKNETLMQGLENFGKGFLDTWNGIWGTNEQPTTKVQPETTTEEPNTSNIALTSAAITEADNAFANANATFMSTSSIMQDTADATKDVNKVQENNNSLLNDLANAGVTVTDEYGNIVAVNGELANNIGTTSASIEDFANMAKTSAKQIQQGTNLLNQDFTPKEQQKQTGFQLLKGTAQLEQPTVENQQATLTVDAEYAKVTEAKTEVQSTINLAKTGVTLKVSTSSNGIDSTQKKLANMEKKASQNTKGGDIKFSTSTDNSGANKGIQAVVSHAAKTVAKVPVRSVPASGAYAAINQLKSYAEKDVSFGVNVKKGNAKHFTVTVKGAYTGLNNKISYHQAPQFGSLVSGTKKGRIGPKGKGGLTLTGEEGYEVAWLPSQGKSMILGVNGPEMLNLPKDAVVYNHEQSKEIVKKKQIPSGSVAIGAGSMEPGAYGDRGGEEDDTPSKKKKNGGNGGNGKGKGKGKGEILIAKSAKIVTKLGKISVWWENISKRVSTTERFINKNQKAFEKELKRVGTTISSLQKFTDDYAKYLGQQMTLNQTIVNKYQKDLDKLLTNGGKNGKGQEKYSTGKKVKSANKAQKELELAKAEYEVAKSTKSKKDDKKAKARYKKAKRKANKKKLSDVTGGSIKTVSYEDTIEVKTRKGKKKNGKYKTSTKKKKVKTKRAVDFSKILYEDEDGNILINQAALDEAAGKNKKGKVNKKAAKAIKEKAQKLAEKQKRRDDAQDKLDTAREQLQQLGKDIFDEFYGWKNELNEIWRITQKIAENEKKRETFETGRDLIQSYLSSGMADLSDSFVQMGTKLFGGIVQSYALNIKNAAAAVDQLGVDFQNALTLPEMEGWKAEQQAIIDEYANKDEAKLSEDDLSRLNQARGKLEQINTRIDAKDLAKKYFDLDLDKNSGTITVKFDSTKLEADYLSGGMTNTTYTAIKEYIENIQSLADSIYEQIQNQMQYFIELNNLLRELREQYADYADELLQAYEDMQQGEVDRLEDIYNSLENHFKDLIDAVKKQLELRRQEEDNAKTEADINKKQQRLALLRSNTSGGNKTEIAQLKQEIADAQLNYGRTLEDQLLSKLEEQADEAAKQREMQIKLMNAQLQILHVTGANAEHIDELMQGVIDGNTDAINEVRLLYNEAHEYNAQTKARQDLLDADFNVMIDSIQNYESNIANVIKAINDTKAVIEELRDKLDALLNQLNAEHVEEFDPTTVKVNSASRTKLLNTKASNNALIAEYTKARDEATSDKDKANYEYLIKQLENDNAEIDKALADLPPEINKVNFTVEQQKDILKNLEIEVPENFSDLSDLNEEQLTKIAKMDLDLLSSATGLSTVESKGFQQMAAALANIKFDPQITINQNGTYSYTDSEGKKQEGNYAGAGGNPSNPESSGEESAAKAAAKQAYAQYAADIITSGDIDKEKLEKAISLGQSADMTKNEVAENLVAASNTGTTWKKLFTAADKAGYNFTQQQELIGDNSYAKKAYYEWLIAKSNDEGSINATKIKNRFAAGEAIGLSNYQVAKELAETKGLTWKQVLKAIKDAKISGIDGHTVKNWNSSASATSNFRQAFEDVYGKWSSFKQGGFANFTGPAWLDGTRAQPEAVLSATDTKNFIKLRDVLSDVMGSISNVSSVESAPVTYDIDINVDHISSDYDVDRIAERIEKKIVHDASYRNVTAVRQLR